MKVIHSKYLPTALPIRGSAIVWLVTEQIRLPAVAVGVVWTLWALYVAACIGAIVKQEYGAPNEVGQ